MFAACNRLYSCRSFHLNLTLIGFAGWKLVDRQKEGSATGLHCVNFSGHFHFSIMVLSFLVLSGHKDPSKAQGERAQ